jgi:two-component system sensor histidine kinase PhoQ
MKRHSSLIRRMLLASAALLPLLLSFSAFMLNRAYISSLDEAEKETMLAQLYALMAVADFGDEGLSFPEVMANPQFETPESGLYAQVSGEHGAVWRSNSLSAFAPSMGSVLVEPELGSSLWMRHEINGQALTLLRFGSVWEIEGRDYPYTFDIAQSQSSKKASIRAYQRSLIFWLGGMAVLLIGVQLAIVRWGLNPLKRIAREINLIESGQKESLLNDYPQELQPLTASLNKLLSSEQQQRERYKNSLADLAHSLKTPLTVMRSLLDTSRKDSSDALLDEQIDRMSSIVSHQLQRASAQVRTLYGQTVRVAKIVDRLGAAMGKVYQDKNIEFENRIATSLRCQIAKDDLMELLGNLIENAFKYGHQRVWVEASETDTELCITISDDGPGVPVALQTEILRRGSRADTSKIGQGIGLSIAVDILSSYNGSLNLGTSAANGAEFTVTFSK